MREIWKPVVGHPGYEVSSLGRVRSLPRTKTHVRLGTKVTAHFKGAMLRQNPDRNGYPKVGLTSSNQLVHVLVLEAFRGQRPEGKESLHRDGNRANSRLNNLRWGTHDENIRDAMRHGTTSRQRHG